MPHRRTFLQAMLAAPALPLASRAAPDDKLLAAGCLDVTSAPYSADPTGTKDSTAAIQRAVNDARDRQLACFFPSGTYLLSDTISCEQAVQKLGKPRFTDGMRQSYWEIPGRTCILIGSTAGRRPVLKLAPDAKGFDDPNKPKNLIYIWAQTRNDAPGREEPEWGKEQPNISFGHTFKGIDIDVRGHAGAVGIRHTGSQGATLLDSTILADGAYAGMNNCPGQGGGTYNIEVRGGQYGMIAGPECRFPMLAACDFRGQTTACVSYSTAGLPMVLVGCRFEPAAGAAIDLTANKGLTGVSIIDSVIRIGKSGPAIVNGAQENLYLENCYVQGAAAIHANGGKLPDARRWTRIERYSWRTPASVAVVNGKVSEERDIARFSRADAPRYQDLHARHWSRLPSFEDAEAVSVKAFGAVGDGKADDSAAFRKAISAHKKLFIPRGTYRLTEPLRLRDTALFGVHRSLAVLQFDPALMDGDKPVVTMPDDPAATVSLTFLSARGLVEWTAGRGLVVLAPARLHISGNGGGRFCGVTGIGRGFQVSGTRQPVAFYALNVERIRTNPQSEIRDAENVRIYYLKAEATPVGYGVGVAEKTGNTPLAIVRSRDVRVYCMNGNIVTAEKRPMLDLVDSDRIVVTHAKSFKTGDFAQVREVKGSASVDVPSDRAAALLIRE